MAELIDREAFLKRFTSEYRCKFTFGEAKILNVMFEELKKEATTTEAEIREKEKAEVIDEFAEKLKESLVNNYRHLITTDTDGFDWLTTDAVGTHIDKLSEQLKEE